MSRSAFERLEGRTLFASCSGLGRTSPRRMPSDPRRRRDSIPVQVERLEDRRVLSGALSASLVIDIVPGPDSGGPTGLVNANGTLFFTGPDFLDVHGGIGLWTSDGTTAGTRQVASDTGSSEFLQVGDSVFYASGLGGIWTSDGTAAGTLLLTPTADPGGAELTAVGDKVFFSWSTEKTGRELWVTDGTPAGTKLVKDIQRKSYWTTFTDWSGTHRVRSSDSAPAGLTNVNGTLFFTAYDTKNGRGLWKSDGTDAGTTLVTNIVNGKGGVFLQSPTALNGALYFITDGGVWKSNGTTAGTKLVKQVLPSTPDASASLSNFTDVDGVLYFSARSGTSGQQIWKSDGTTAGTVMIKDIGHGSFWTHPRFKTNVNGTLFFLADDGIHGEELWKSDGTADGTVMVRDIAPGKEEAYPYVGSSELTNLNGMLYFRADDRVHGLELWQSDGTEAGTVLVADIKPGNNSNPKYLTAMNNKLYFAADDGTHGVELWQLSAAEAEPVTVLADDSVADVTSPTLGSTASAGLDAFTVKGVARNSAFSVAMDIFGSYSVIV